jgi:L-fuculose-phosphate aldolase
VGAVARSHAEADVAFAATGMPLEAVGHEGTLFVPPDIARFPGAGDLIRDPELGADLAHALGDRNAVLLPRHGLVTVGLDVSSAVLVAIFLEKACRMQLTVAAAARQVPSASEAEKLAKRDRCHGARGVG